MSSKSPDHSMSSKSPDHPMYSNSPDHSMYSKSPNYQLSSKSPDYYLMPLQPLLAPAIAVLRWLPLQLALVETHIDPQTPDLPELPRWLPAEQQITMQQRDWRSPAGKPPPPEEKRKNRRGPMLHMFHLELRRHPELTIAGVGC